MVIPLQQNTKHFVLMDSGQILPHLSVGPTEHRECNFNESSNTRKRRRTKKTNRDQAGRYIKLRIKSEICYIL